MNEDNFSRRRGEKQDDAEIFTAKAQRAQRKQDALERGLRGITKSRGIKTGRIRNTEYTEENSDK